MTKSRQETVYLKAERNVEVQGPEVTLGDVVQILCGDPGMAGRIRQISLLKFTPGKRGQDRVVVSVLRVVECIRDLYPQAEIRSEEIPDLIVKERGQLRFIRGKDPRFVFQSRERHADCGAMLKKAEELIGKLRLTNV